MMAFRAKMKHIMFYMIFIFFLLGFPCSYADPTPFNSQNLPACDPKCGCDGMYIYNEVKDECVLNMQKLMKRVVVRYDNQNIEDILAKDGMERSIYIEGQKLFRGIMISVILFMTCAAICVISACLYCCRINYSDRKLKQDVKALAKKMNRDYKTKKDPLIRKEYDQKSQNCNVLVEEAGVMVV